MARISQWLPDFFSDYKWGVEREEICSWIFGTANIFFQGNENKSLLISNKPWKVLAQVHNVPGIKVTYPKLLKKEEERERGERIVLHRNPMCENIICYDYGTNCAAFPRLVPSKYPGLQLTWLSTIPAKQAGWDLMGIQFQPSRLPQVEEAGLKWLGLKCSTNTEMLVKCQLQTA